MSRLPSVLAVILLPACLLIGAAHADGKEFNLGIAASAKEIAGWDIDIRSDGKGLPMGSGNALDGESEYEMLCESCHGVFGEGEGRWPALTGGEGTLTDVRPLKTVGSYWPYASTLFDYIRRAMPFTAPMSLSDKQVYEITAYVLYMNDIIDEDFELSNDNLASIVMPNQDNFFIDDRPDVQNSRCMNNCLDAGALVLTDSLSGVTPIGHFVAGADAPAASHEEQRELEEQKEAELTDNQITGDRKTAEEESTLSVQAQAGQLVYQGACFACHDSGVAGAPKLGNTDVWSKRLAQGIDTLIFRAIHGYSGSDGVMPPKGGRLDLSDEQVEQAVYFMVESSR